MVIVLLLGRHHILCCCSGLAFAESSPLQQNSKRLCSSCQGDDAILVRECPSIRVKENCSWIGTLDHLMYEDVHPSISSRLHLIPAVSSSKVCLSIVRVCVCVSDLGHLVWLLREERDAQCLEQGRVLVHVLAPTLFNMPSIFDKVGQLVNLPHPTMQLPWDKLVCWVFMGFGTLELCLARHWKNWGNVVFGWFVLWLLFFTGSSSSPMKGWIEFLCSVDDASSVWCSYPSQGHQKSGKLLPKQDVRTLISVCCVCVWLMPHNPKLHCLQLSATCTPIAVRDHSCLWPCFDFSCFV